MPLPDADQAGQGPHAWGSFLSAESALLPAGAPGRMLDQGRPAIPRDSWSWGAQRSPPPHPSASPSSQALSSLIFSLAPAQASTLWGRILPTHNLPLGQGHRGRAGTYLERRMTQFCALLSSITDSSLTLREARWDVLSGTQLFLQPKEAKWQG